MIKLALSLMQRRFHHKVTGFYGGNMWPDTVSRTARTPSAEAILADTRRHSQVRVKSASLSLRKSAYDEDTRRKLQTTLFWQTVGAQCFTITYDCLRLRSCQRTGKYMLDPFPFASGLQSMRDVSTCRARPKLVGRPT